MRGSPWRIMHGGALRAEVVARVPAAAVKRIARAVGALKNPTLVHHGMIARAAWHLLEEPGGSAAPLPLADLYALTQAQAAKIAQVISDALNKRIIVLDNRDVPPGTPMGKHPATGTTPRRRARRNPANDPVPGEVWTTLAGDKVRVRDVDGNRVDALNLDTGNRDPIDLREFLLTYRPPRVRRNPKGRKPSRGTVYANPTQRETELAARLVRDLGFKAMGDEIAFGGASIGDTFRQLIASRLVPESRKVLLRTALVALERGYGSRSELAETLREAFAALADEKARAAKHPANRWDNPNPRGRKRSRTGEMARARRTAQMWNEFPATTARRVRVRSRTIPAVLVKGGDVHSIVYRSNKYDGKHKLHEHRFKRPLPVLGFDPDGRAAYLVGGGYKITGDGLVD